MELLIDKKYLVRLECYTRFCWGGVIKPYAVRYVFKLPERAGVPDGYTIYIDADYHRSSDVIWENNDIYTKHPIGTKELEHDKTYRLDRPSNAVYVAKMTENREEGKRYKQYKYTAEELYALYQNVDLKSAQRAVAKIDIYIDGREGERHKIIYGNRIDKTLYLVGKVQGCWFYCSELDTKRRIGSHGVNVLGKISAENEAKACELIRKAELKVKICKKEFSLISDSKRDAEEAFEAVNHYGAYIQRTDDKSVTDAMNSILCAAQNAMQLIDKKLSEESTSILGILQELEEQLKKLYIKES